jgi:hypothetical protein
MKFPKFPVLLLFFPIQRAPAPNPKVVGKNTAPKQSLFPVTSEFKIGSINRDYFLFSKYFFNQTHVFNENFEG